MMIMMMVIMIMMFSRVMAMQMIVMILILMLMIELIKNSSVYGHLGCQQVHIDDHYDDFNGDFDVDNGGGFYGDDDGNVNIDIDQVH